MKLYNDDCCNILQRIENSSIDLVICDPPYGMSYRSGKRKEQHKKMISDEDISVVENVVDSLYDVCKDNTALYIFCSQHNIHNFIKCLSTKFKLKNILVWVKNNHTSGDLKAAYAKKTEYILYMNKGRRFLEGKRDQDVLYFNKTLNKLHPTQKPVDLIGYLISKSSIEGDVVLNFCMGSGTTGIACKNLNRKFVGVEIDNDYYDIAVKRIEGVT